MTVFCPRPIAGLALASLLFAASCGDQNPPAASTDTAPTTQATTTTPPTTKVDPAKVKAEVTTAYTTFFEHFKGDPALLQDGAKMAAGIKALAASERAPGVTVTVKDVKPIDAAACETAAVESPCAEVKFDLNLNGNPVLPDQNGYAVQQDGKWKVSTVTFCALAVLGGSTPEGC